MKREEGEKEKERAETQLVSFICHFPERRNKSVKAEDNLRVVSRFFCQRRRGFLVFCN